MIPVCGFASPWLRRCLRGGSVLLLAFLVGSCGGGDRFAVDTGRIAERFLPSERSVHHPDSLRALTITEEDGKIQYQLEQDYQSLIEKWSCSYQNVGAGPSIESRTYATFQSLELALVSLQPEMGVLSLRKEQARDLIEKRRKAYFDRIRIDVYWFTRRGMDGIITGPGARTELVVGDRTLRPVRSDHGPLREAYVIGGDVALYRRNTLYFPRTVEDTDILKGSSGVQLTVRRTGGASKEKFSWRWRTSDQ